MCQYNPDLIFWLYSQNALIWCIFLEMLEDRADGAEGVSGLVVEGGYADAGAEGRDRRDFGGSVSWGSLLCAIELGIGEDRCCPRCGATGAVANGKARGL